MQYEQTHGDNCKPTPGKPISLAEFCANRFPQLTIGEQKMNLDDSLVGVKTIFKTQFKTLRVTIFSSFDEKIDDTVSFSVCCS